MDTLTASERSERMSLVRNRDTKPEVVVRSIVSSLGYRYRLNYPKLPGRPDLALLGRKKVIMVHGCFWHRHPDQQCPLARWPKSRLEFWVPKLEGNRARDLEKERQLRALGFKVMVVWECDLVRLDEEKMKGQLQKFLEGNDEINRAVHRSGRTRPGHARRGVSPRRTRGVERGSLPNTRKER